MEKNVLLSKDKAIVSKQLASNGLEIFDAKTTAKIQKKFIGIFEQFQPYEIICAQKKESTAFFFFILTFEDGLLKKTDNGNGFGSILRPKLPN